MKKTTNANKIIAYTVIAMVLAAVIEFCMYAQVGQAWNSAAVLGRVGFLVVLAVLVVIFVALRVRLSSYVTILVNLYLGIINLGGLLQVHDRSAMSGLLIQLVAICGIVVAVAGVIQGIRQRLNYTYSRLEGK
ncbi:hypothetical protein [Limosilactobacillus fermentum]|uniref:hypothetical protein n=1 Tax=Limosilactobacillus fermentum TaxID=1613 RepID=UPI002166821E|nr:hypothetical protein [Limosilactobacillus fermentum]UVW02779.1 hypothetical protein NX839_06360 [Limosilactobacillus fermentum]WEN05246.1 hypothetical protein P0M30_09105 [Limosilactobacillus fermentum]WEN12100.1 hypothetical protein P0N62_09115 [Limosilactobacillus fermentum]WJD38754.1 hypothetical protein QRA02_09115 [Limosilactobacillus fermentum]